MELNIYGISGRNALICFLIASILRILFDHDLDLIPK